MNRSKKFSFVMVGLVALLTGLVACPFSSLNAQAIGIKIKRIDNNDIHSMMEAWSSAGPLLGCVEDYDISNPPGNPNVVGGLVGTLAIWIPEVCFAQNFGLHQAFIDPEPQMTAATLTAACFSYHELDADTPAHLKAKTRLLVDQMTESEHRVAKKGIFGLDNKATLEPTIHFQGIGIDPNHVHIRLPYLHEPLLRAEIGDTFINVWHLGEGEFWFNGEMTVDSELGCVEGIVEINETHWGSFDVIFEPTQLVVKNEEFDVITEDHTETSLSLGATSPPNPGPDFDEWFFSVRIDAAVINRQ